MCMKLLLLALVIIPVATCLEGLVAEGNPHTIELRTAALPACCPAQSLPPERMMLGAATLRRQQDTFVRMHMRSHLGRQVEVFTFRQPARLSHLELPFDLALVDDIDPSDIVEVATPPADASDSWFPDYVWSSFVVCTAGGVPRHLGWRYTRKAGAIGGGPRSFVALIVRSSEAEAEAVPPAQSKAAIVEAVALPAGKEELAMENIKPLPVGMEAPAWMATMLAAVTARSVRSN
eukprot:CAMPEP_0174716014 /NCGR_PEP_ID=MMETSP1094-20130205/22739_1 /TAXON_ID=156173 /ORGANISM="Chrysochromulina brevifilum, Strain UTEX LB 985" /LENGTH=233 /DNA_ID=CAMNT_0015915687 /DNA_START=150 /DNA_END=851 /DNA_ORIENTATION=-